VNPEAAKAAVVLKASDIKASKTTSASLCTVLDRDAKRLAEKTTDVILWDNLLRQPVGTTGEERPCPGLYLDSARASIAQADDRPDFTSV
jgi:hypothetical protein